MMKRILLILPNLDLGGTETLIMNFFRHINRAEIIFDFVVHEDSGYYEEEARELGARIFRAPTRGRSFVGNISAMRKIYKNSTGKANRPVEKYDFVIVCTEHAFGFIELAVAWACGVRVRAAWSLFSDYQGKSRVKRAAHFLARPFMRLFSNLRFACSPDAGKWLFGKSLHKKFFHIINNATDLDKFAYDPETRERIREKHGLGKKFVLGLVGRISAVKNHAFALEVFKEVLAACENAAQPTDSQPAHKDAVLLIVGDGELRGEIEAAAQGLPVIFTGRVDDAADYYQALDMLLIPSFHEGLPLTAIEAQASGLPVLMSDGLPPEAKITENAVFLSLNSNWAAEIKKIMENPPERTAINLENSGFHIKREAEKFQKILSEAFR